MENEAARQRLEIVARVVNILAALAAVAGGIFALWSYQQERERRVDDTKMATLRFVELFNSDEFLNVRVKTLDYIDRGIACEPGIATGPERLNVFTYVDFFDSLLICVNEGICDRRTAFEFFERYANYHWPALERHIQGTREMEKGFDVEVAYGAGLEAMARQSLKVFVRCEESAPAQ